MCLEAFLPHVCYEHFSYSIIVGQSVLKEELLKLCDNCFVWAAASKSVFFLYLCNVIEEVPSDNMCIRVGSLNCGFCFGDLNAGFVICSDNC